MIFCNKFIKSVSIHEFLLTSIYQIKMVDAGWFQILPHNICHRFLLCDPVMSAGLKPGISSLSLIDTTTDIPLATYARLFRSIPNVYTLTSRTNREGTMLRNHLLPQYLEFLRVCSQYVDSVMFQWFGFFLHWWFLLLPNPYLEGIRHRYFRTLSFSRRYFHLQKLQIYHARVALGLPTINFFK